jgi:hypothetical protein
MEIVVKIEDAIWSLTQNREQHLKDYDLQLAAWKLEYKKYQDARDAWINSTKLDMKKEPKAPYKPTNHLEDYDKLITKLDWLVGDTVKLMDYEYSAIFEDDFNWKHGYINSATLAAGAITASSISTGIVSDTMVDYAEQRLAELGYKKEEK